jgi:hypothetical protein
MKEEGLCDVDVKFEELKEKELKIYNAEAEKYKAKFESFPIWSRALQNMITYKQPHICGVDQM